MPRSDVATRPASFQDPAYQAFWLLRIGFVVAPILFGLDKFFDWLVDWDRYLAPEFNDLFPGNAHQAMYAVGAIEIVAGLVVAVRPRFGGYLVAAWLAGIIVNLLLIARLLRRRAARLRAAARRADPRPPRHRLPRPPAGVSRR